jgi:F-type H+-transporting ATPase subunit a
MMSSAFHPELLGHGNGHAAVDGYVLHGGTIKRVADKSFPMGEVEIKGFRHGHTTKDGKEVEASFVCTGQQEYILDAKSTADAGLFGGGITSFYDFSLTKNVVTMLLVCFFLFLMFRSVAKSYSKRDGKAPSGLQSLMETVIVFLRDEVAIPFIGHKWERYFGFLMSVFFFILGLNLFGQVPFFGGSNVTGNLGVTMVLAIIAFLVTNLSGNKHYWSHLFLAPGVPWFVKIILVPVEIMGMFIKPLTLMLRLFANITAGHIVMIVFVGLIFIFGKSGESVGGALGASVGSTLLTMFMMAIELIVAFVQAFVFTILTASYIGAATEEAHH